MPDEDVCHAVAMELLHHDPLLSIKFEQIWGRWDMTAVKRQEPVIPDLEVSSEKIDQLRMEAARKLAKDSPDWWRQIGAMAFWSGRMIACSRNAHYPTEYETALFGDPRINFNAGDPAGAEVYLSLHARERSCGRLRTRGCFSQRDFCIRDNLSCGDCARMLAQCRIKELFFSEGYSVLKGFETLKAADIRIVKVRPRVRLARPRGILFI